MYANKDERAIRFATTPGKPLAPGKKSVFGTIKDLKDPKTGKNIMNVLILGSVCPDCAAKGKTGSCIHRPFNPIWHNSAKKDEVQQIYEALGLGDTFNQEMNAIMQSSFIKKSFSDEDIKNIRERKTKGGSVEPPVIFISVDPSAGGDSEYAVMAGWFSRKGLLHVSIFLLLIEKNEWIDRN